METFLSLCVLALLIVGLMQIVRGATGLQEQRRLVDQNWRNAVEVVRHAKLHDQTLQECQIEVGLMADKAGLDAEAVRQMQDMVERAWAHDEEGRNV
jgi:hypothetical protein